LDDLIAAIADTAGCPTSVKFTLRQVEINRDLPVADARGVAHGLKHAPNPWYRISTTRHCVPHPDLKLDGNDVTVTWPADAKDLPKRFKFYAKRPDRLRTEVCLDSPDAVAAMLAGGRVSTPPQASNGSELAQLLSFLVTACVPYLDAMEDHVPAVSGPRAGPLELMATLAPLLRLTVPPPPSRPGRPRSDSTKRDAENALFHLLEVGRFAAPGRGGNKAVREALDCTVKEGGLLADRKGMTPLYTVPPRMLAARLALSRSLWPDSVRGGADQLVEEGDV
jgi:hypothetical protein